MGTEGKYSNRSSQPKKVTFHFVYALPVTPCHSRMTCIFLAVFHDFTLEGAGTEILVAIAIGVLFVYIMISLVD